MSDTIDLVINEETIMDMDSYSIIEPVMMAVNIYENMDTYNKSLEPFSLEQRYLLGVQWYISEVNNGGHHQFYTNNTGIVWEDALEGLKLVGQDTIYDILYESLQRLGGNPSKDYTVRLDTFVELDPDFDDLDTRFYENSEYIEPALLEYIFNNKDKFYFEGTISY